MDLINLTKIDVARRQLATAVRLHFGHGDPVSVYALASNAWEIIDTLCKHDKVDNFSNVVRAEISDGLDLAKHFINPDRNFSKHADRDPGGTLEILKGSNVDGVLFLAVHDYFHLAPAAPVEFQVFEAWYLALHPEKLADDVPQELLVLRNAFPGIAQRDRRGQLQMGADMLTQAENNPDIAKDPRTATAF